MRIRRKLLLLVMGVTAGALVLAAAIQLASDFLRLRRELLVDLATMAAVVADQSTAALAFDDPSVAAENLSALRANSAVVLACLYDAEDDLFTAYRRLDVGVGCPGAVGRVGSALGADAAELWRPVDLDGKRIGTLFLRSDLQPIRRRLAMQGGVNALALGLALAIAFVAAVRFLRVVSAPITELAAAATAVSQLGDYGIRARRTSSDEVGDLVIAFNRMMDQIERSDRDLRHEVEERLRAESEKEDLLLREQAARSEAEAADRLKDEFLATLSHELRTPLNAILGWAAVLRARGPEDQATVVRAGEVIERNARAQAQLVTDLLDTSAIITGKLPLELRTTDLADVVRAAVDTVRPAAEARQIAIDCEIGPDVPCLRADPARLQQTVWNLVSNAVKFSPAGGRVEVRARRDGDEVEVSVRDEGIGISPEFLPHVFERFRQQDSSTTRTHGGLGLGLAIVRHLVELHGGRVGVDSAGAGKGATFRFWLPVSGEPAGRVDLPPESPAADLAGVRVLVVEDDPDTRELCRVALEGAGATVTAVGSVGEGLAAASDRALDAIVSDIALPGRDGYAFIEEVRRRGRVGGGDVPAAAMTAYAGERDSVRALAAGFDLHLAKPLNPSDLVAAVRDLIEIGRSRGTAPDPAGHDTRP